MAQDKIAYAAVNAVSRLMQRMPDASSKADALCVMMMTNYNLMRNVEGDDYVRAWLQKALEDLDTNPPVINLNEMH